MKQRKIAHCHYKIRTVAKELCGASYDMLMVDNMLYATWRKSNPDLVRGPTWDSKALRARFVEKNWGRFIEGARTTMALLLRQPTSPSLTDAMKEEIVEILALDSQLIRGRKNPAIVAGELIQKH